MLYMFEKGHRTERGLANHKGATYIHGFRCGQYRPRAKRDSGKYKYCEQVGTKDSYEGHVFLLYTDRPAATQEPLIS